MTAVVGGEPSAPAGLDAFVSYSRRDAARVMEIVAAARERGRTMWVDTDDIPAGAPWRTELGTAIEAADAVVCCISPEWLASVECQNEYRRAVELGKRLIPVQLAAVAERPEALGALHWLQALDGEPAESVATAVLAAADVDPAGVREHTHWLARALRWDARERDRSLLLRGRDLRAAEDWLGRAGTTPAPVPLQTGFVAASRTAERRRLRTTITVTAATLVVTLVLGLVAVVQWREAVQQRDQARSQALAAAALTQLDVDPERSLLLARAALASARTDQAVGALRASLDRSRVRLRIAAHADKAAIGVAWSPDGRTLVSAGRDGTVSAWDAATGESRGGLATGSSPVTGLTAATAVPAGVVTTEDGQLLVWALRADGTPTVRARPVPSGVTSATISADGRVVAAGTADGTVSLWNADGSSRGSVHWTAARVGAVALSADGATLVVGDDDGVANIGPTGAAGSTRWVRHSSAIKDAQLNTDGTVALTAAMDGDTSMRRVADGTEVMAPQRALYAAIDPAGRRMVTAGGDGSVVLADADGGRATLSGPGSAAATAGFSPDGSLVQVARSDGTVTAWRAADGAPVAQLRGGHDLVTSASFAPDGARLLSGDGSGEIRVWALPGRPLALPVGAGTGRESVFTVDLSPDGARVVTAGWDAPARVWDSRTGAEQAVGTGCVLPPTGPGCLGSVVAQAVGDQVTVVRHSPDGHLGAAGAHDGAVVVWDVATAAVVARLPPTTIPQDALAFSADGRLLALGDRHGRTRVVEARTGQEVATLPGVPAAITAVAFTPDGHLLTGNEQGVVLHWNVQTGNNRIIWLAEDGAYRLALDAGGRTLAVAGSDDILLIDLTGGRPVRRLVGHTGFVDALEFAADGVLLVSGGRDGTVRVWEVDSGQQATVLATPGDVSDLAVDPGGRRVAVVTDVGEGAVLDCAVCGPPDELAALAAQHSTRELTDDERWTFGLAGEDRTIGAGGPK